MFFFFGKINLFRTIFTINIEKNLKKCLGKIANWTKWNWWGYSVLVFPEAVMQVPLLAGEIQGTSNLLPHRQNTIQIMEAAPPDLHPLSSFHHWQQSFWFHYRFVNSSTFPPNAHIYTYLRSRDQQGRLTGSRRWAELLKLPDSNLWELCW